MNSSVNKLLSLDREEMTELERELFLKDLKRVTDEYFESDGLPSLEITRAEGGSVVCLLVTARRIKNVKKPID